MNSPFSPNPCTPDRLHKSLLQFSSSIFTMTKAEDLENLVVAMWVELSLLGVELSYCGIATVDQEKQEYDFYGIHQQGLLVAEGIPLAFGFPAQLQTEVPQPDFFPGGERFLRYRLAGSTLRGWLEKVNESGFTLRGPVPGILEGALEAVEIPFRFGSLQMMREGGAPFSLPEIEVAEDFAQLLSFGYSRYLDIRRLEKQNLNLKAGRAADRVHQAVMNMQGTEDWGKVVGVMYRELVGLGFNFEGCSINILDYTQNLFRQYIVLPSSIRKNFKPSRPYQSLDDNTDLFVLERPMVPGILPAPQAEEAWRNNRVYWRVVDEPERQRIAERSRQLMGFEASLVEFYPRCLVDVPFSHGMISLASSVSEYLAEKEITILQQIAQAISLGYARYLDMKALEQKNRELQETQAQLVQAAKLAAMGELVAGVAHEINTPLGTINSNLDVIGRAMHRLRRQMEEAPDSGWLASQQLLDSIDPLLEVSQSACERMIRIVRDLRTFARLDEAEFKPADLNADLDSVLALIQHELKNRIQVFREYGELPPVHCYPHRLNQVFMNLLINACQSIPAQGQIRIRSWRENDKVKIVISDTGEGIKTEHLNRIFDPGFTTKGVGVGTGLGLSISARIIQDHRGTIQVASQEGKGTTFTLTLPIRPDQGPGFFPGKPG